MCIDYSSEFSKKMLKFQDIVTIEWKIKQSKRKHKLQTRTEYCNRTRKTRGIHELNRISTKLGDISRKKGFVKEKKMVGGYIQ